MVLNGAVNLGTEHSVEIDLIARLLKIMICT
jgi:hypothetical protein